MRFRPSGPLSALVPAIAATLVGTAASAQSVESAPLGLVATVPQIGPVGYRDPFGVISPDGDWLAFTSGGWLRVTHAAGGPVRTIARFRGIYAVTWQPDGRTIAARAVDTLGALRWLVVDATTGATRDIWSGPFPGPTAGSGPVDPRFFFSVAWSNDGTKLAGISFAPAGSALWTGNADGTNGRVVISTSQLSNPVWTPDGKTVACLALSQGHQQVSIPCGSTAPSPVRFDAYGPIAFSPDGSTLYFASPNARGTLDLYAQPTAGGPARRISSFSRDSYAPSVAKTGRVVFGVQDYRTFIAVTPSSGGPARQVTAFQSETPSWSRDDRTMGVTYGSWRRVVDDLRYPDIAQDLGLVRLDTNEPLGAPTRIIRNSPSEDQGLDWSPDGRWITLHSHANGLDDVWLQPSDGSAPAHAITSGGIETGWPRWSPDGRWIAYTTELRESAGVRGFAFVIGVDPSNGNVTRAAQRIPITGVAGDIEATEWLSPDSLVILGREPDTQSIYVVSRDGGAARLVHRYASEQEFSGLGVAPNGRWVAYGAPAPDGHRQVFRIPLAGGAPLQLTTDPTDKTQPAVSHDGTRVAYTVYSYQMQFWRIDPP
jgi:Tol biopolymer transport system component